MKAFFPNILQLYWMVLFPIMKIISYKWCVVKEHNIILLNENYLIKHFIITIKGYEMWILTLL
jgi:hypothetical protein